MLDTLFPESTLFRSNSSTQPTSAPASANPQPRRAARHDDSALRLIHTSGTTKNTVASAKPHSSETACAARVAWPDSFGCMRCHLRSMPIVVCRSALGREALPAKPGRARVRSYKGRHCPRRARRLQYRPHRTALSPCPHIRPPRSEEHTSELQSLMRHSYAVFCLQKKK